MSISWLQMTTVFTGRVRLAVRREREENRSAFPFIRADIRPADPIRFCIFNIYLERYSSPLAMSKDADNCQAPFLFGSKIFFFTTWMNGKCVMASTCQRFVICKALWINTLFSFFLWACGLIFRVVLDNKCIPWNTNLNSFDSWMRSIHHPPRKL
jgi:hypothetical protein